jgi:hypothetical protein
MYPHPAITAEVGRQRRADLIVAAGNFRRTRALRPKRSRWPLRKVRRQFRLRVPAAAKLGGGRA